MVLNTLVGRAIVGKEIAKNQGITDPAEQLRLGLVGGLVGSPTLGLIATTAISRQQANNPTDSLTDGTIDISSETLAKVPDVKQYNSVEQADAAIKRLALKTKVVSVSSVNDKAGVIISQSPDAGKLVSQGTTVEIRVSQDAAVEEATGEMPLVKGMSLQDAKAAIISAGKIPQANISVVYCPTHNGAAPDDVIMQNPDPGSAINSQTQPTLVIVRAVDVPDLIGMPVEQAILMLLGKQLTYETTPPNMLQGKVIAQQPEHGASVAMFSSVQLTVESQLTYEAGNSED